MLSRISCRSCPGTPPQGQYLLDGRVRILRFQTKRQTQPYWVYKPLLLRFNLLINSLVPDEFIVFKLVYCLIYLVYTVCAMVEGSWYGMVSV